MTIPGRPGPSVSTMLRRGLTIACPACGSRRLFRRWVSMVDDCPRCGLHFERIEGHWIGAVGINTILSFGTLAVTLIVGFVATFPDFPVRTLMVIGAVESLLVPTFFFPISKTLWTAIDVSMRPLEATEVDWRVVDPALAPDPPDHTSTDGHDTHD